jgi:hypothetical protein
MFRVQGAVFRVQGSRFRVWGPVYHLGLWVEARVRSVPKRPPSASASGFLFAVLSAGASTTDAGSAGTDATARFS